MANLTGRSIAPKEVGRTKQKVCKHCRNKFTPAKPLQTCCDWSCAAGWARTQREKKERLELREAKEKIKSRSEYIKDAQLAFNKFIRIRDKGRECICCGLPTKDGDHAGHWKPTSSSPELRFNEDNVHLQRIQCNVFLHGNVAHYRTGLIKRIGLDRVEKLEAKHEPKKWTIEELKEIKSKYSKLARELEKQLENRS